MEVVKNLRLYSIAQKESTEHAEAMAGAKRVDVSAGSRSRQGKWW